MSAERQLLFAVLAFESELLELAQLTSACRAWAEDKSKVLSDLLVERGWLTLKNREFIDELWLSQTIGARCSTLSRR